MNLPENDNDGELVTRTIADLRLFVKEGREIAQLDRRERQLSNMNDRGEATRALTQWKISVGGYLAETVNVDHFAFVSFQDSVRAGRMPNIDAAIGSLNGLIALIERKGALPSKQPVRAKTIDALEEICERFHLVTYALRDRQQNRTPLIMDDEYDVQYLLHALLRSRFDDVRPEETTPSYAGGQSRTDFLLTREQTFVEVKRTRKGMTPKTLGEELLIDVARYQQHPDCKSLVCFVFDPDARIGNPRGLENDVESQGARSGLPVRVFIRPK